MGHIKRYLAVAILFVMGPWMVINGTKELIHSRQLAARGKTAVAVASHRSRYEGRYSTSYYVQATFLTESGRSVSENFTVSEAEYERVATVPTLTVRYLPEDPTVCAAGVNPEWKFGNLLLGLFMSAGAVFLVLVHRQTGKNIAKEVGKLCVDEHEYAPADARQFRHLDLAWLDAAREKLGSLGFTFLQDMENLTFTRSNSSPRTFLRIHLGRNGTTMAALYHFKPAWWMQLLGAKEAKVCDAESQFSDGTWVCTGNAEAAGLLDSPPGVDSIHFPRNTPIDAVVQAHDARVAKHMARAPGVQPVRLASIEDVLRAQARLQKIKSAFRRGHGISKAELERIAGTQCEDLDAMHAEAQRSHAQRQSRAA